MKTILFQTGLVTVICMMLGACSSSDNTINDENNGKIPIVFSTNISTASVASRADDVIKPFPANSLLALIISSSDGTNTKTETTSGTTTSTQTATSTAVSFTTEAQKYWDDFYGYNAHLTILGWAIPGKTDAITISPTNPMALSVSNTQTSSTYGNEDAVFTNNIQNGSTDGRLTYDATGKTFPEGNLIFKHACSKFTINMLHGDGFTSSFNPTLTLIGFPTSAKMTLSTGSIVAGSLSGIQNITPEEITATTGFDHSYRALVIPDSRTINDDQALKIVDEDNTYYVKMKDMVASTVTKLESNYNYTVNITLSKTSFTITAALTDWYNTSVTLEPVIVQGSGVGATGTALTTDFSFDMYRSAESTGTTNYNEGGTLKNDETLNKATTVTYTKATNSYSYAPAIYWPNHIQSYYYRATTPGTVVKANTAGDYIPVTSATGGVATGNDLVMGAPYTSYTDYKTSTLAPASLASAGGVNYIFTHMKPEVIVRLQSTTTTDKVDLTDAVVTINNAYTNGSYLMKDLSFTPSGDKSNYKMSAKTGETNTFNSYVIPQNLNGVSMTVTTKDGNSYPVTIYNTANEDGKDWSIGKQYIYTLTLKKTGLSVTSSYADWTKVDTDLPNITL